MESMDYAFPPCSIDTLVITFCIPLPWKSDFFCRALLFNLFTILSFTLGGSDSNSEDHHMHMPSQVVVALRVMVIFSALMDVLCIVGTLVTLMRYRTDYS